ncbi:DUF1592 domain-containing protein [Calycomorphotria hydatis]|uniref:Planctomycete cytochrome C n=1 Tax=Calycomorphotria hydatis TaxID=2528027 RepID=A0A517T810_9PLAN|nr:DUF1592 domain-containing protein [Calycomorphotria hydatis]QDT64502.1 hypothetical protein V22_17360 [Calycomorphotria hydatis]
MTNIIKLSLAFLITAHLIPSPLATAAEAPAAAINKDSHALLLTHCSSCHSEENAEADFRVDNLPLNIKDNISAARWQKVLNALNSGEMPPEGEPAIDKALKADFLDHLANVMVTARSNLADQGGVITMRRLNRREYRNTLRALLGAEVNVSDLPSDTGSGGFDTVGSNLFMSSTQFEQYLALGREALEEAFEWEKFADEHKIHRFEAEEITEKVAKRIEDMVDAKERATQWTKLVDEAVTKPENAEIVEEIRAGPLGNHKHIFYRNWKKFPGVPAPETFGFQTVENNADKAVAALRPFSMPYHQYYMEQPEIDSGAYLAAANEHPSILDNATVKLLVPFSWPVGNYVVRFRAATTEHATPDRKFIEFGINPRSQQALSSHEITGTMDSPQIVEFPLTMTRANRKRETRWLFFREKGTRDDWKQATRVAREGREENNGIGRTFSLWIDWVEIERIPNDDQPTPPGMKALKNLPRDDKTANPTKEELREAFEQFTLAAFRGRVPAPEYVDQLVDIYESHRQLGAKYSDALKETLAVVLSSPMFLYHAEPRTSDQPRPLTDRELANRLSYFLWGSPPDEVLVSHAQNQSLQHPEVLTEQITRLLDDPRSEDFANGLTYQWLGLDRLDFFQVDLQKHKRFDNSTRLAARLEIYETVKYLLNNNASISDLLKSDYVVINSVLANYYGIEDVHGDNFRKVLLPKDSPRGGLMGMAAVHLMGGNGDTTSPVERGAWVLRKLLHDPPPPAPANVPQLARLAGKVLTTKERIVAHQEEPQCASCHRKIDPIGFGMENFDAVGAWRTEDSYQVHDDKGRAVADKKITWTIDPSVTLHKGPTVNSFSELRDYVATHDDDFARGFTEALIQYALGRPVGFTDERLIEDILHQAKDQNYTMRSFVHALVNSPEFQSK